MSDRAARVKRRAEERRLARVAQEIKDRRIAERDRLKAELAAIPKVSSHKKR